MRSEVLTAGNMSMLVFWTTLKTNFRRRLISRCQGKGVIILESSGKENKFSESPHKYNLDEVLVLLTYK
jgi:hypothetical protein